MRTTSFLLAVAAAGGASAQDLTVRYIEDWYYCAASFVGDEIDADSSATLELVVEQAMAGCKPSEDAYAKAVALHKPQADPVFVTSDLRAQITQKLLLEFEGF